VLNCRLPSYAQIVGDLALRLARAAKRDAERNLLVIWVIDSSPSAGHDRKRLRKHLTSFVQKFRTEAPGSKLRQAVVAFGEKPRLLLGPTRSEQEVAAAVGGIESSDGADSENAMAALGFVAEAKQLAIDDARRVAVLVDDDQCDDSESLEETLGKLKRAHITLHAISREAPFLGRVRHMGFAPRSVADVICGVRELRLSGLGTASPEAACLPWGELTRSPNTPSGFGMYDLSRLTALTGGTYYMLGREVIYDWELLELYRPELVSRADYLRSRSQNGIRAELLRVRETWSRGLPRGSHYQWPELAKERERCEKKIVEAGQLAREIETKAIVSPEELADMKPNRRWVANADLMWASLKLARHRLRQYLYAIDEFKKTAASIPDGHQIFVKLHQAPKETPDSAKDLEEVLDALRFVANRHPRTPWGWVASNFSPKSSRCLYGVKLTHGRRYRPYWAKMVNRDGSSKVVLVIGKNEEGKTVTILVPRKGRMERNLEGIRELIRVRRPDPIRRDPIPSL